MLPFINKIKIGDIEIEFESAGFSPPGGAPDVAILETRETQEDIAVEFFFTRFWY